MRYLTQFRQAGSRWGARYVSPTLFAMLLAAIVVVGTLFIPETRGLADNGQFTQILANNGLYPRPGYQQVTYLTPQVGIMQYYNALGAGGLAGFSSQRLFIGLALQLNKWFYSATVFDLRFLGLVYAACFVGAVGLLTRALTRPDRRVRSYVLAGLIVLVFADGNWTLTFNSFYAFPVMLISAMTLTASLLLVGQVRRRRGQLLLLAGVSAGVLVMSQPQNAWVTASCLVMGLGGFYVFKHPAQRLGLGLGGALLIGCGVVMVLALTPQQRSINRYQAFTQGVLKETKDPSSAIARQGVNRQFALMRAQDYYPVDFTELSPQTAYVDRHLTKRVNGWWVANYYAHHMKQLRTLLDLTASNLMVTRLESVGNYLKGHGHAPGAQAKTFTLMSTAAATFFPRRFAFDVLLAVALFLVFGVGAYHAIEQRKAYGLVRFCVMGGLLLNVLGVLLGVVFTAGVTNLTANLFLAPVSLSLVLMTFVADLLNHRLWRADDRQVIEDD